MQIKVGFKNKTFLRINDLNYRIDTGIGSTYIFGEIYTYSTICSSPGSRYMETPDKYASKNRII